MNEVDTTRDLAGNDVSIPTKVASAVVARTFGKKGGGKKAAKKSPPKKTNKNGKAVTKADKRTSNFREDGACTKRQIDVLRVLSKRKQPTTADDVADALKLPDASRKTVRWALGSVRPLSGKVDPCSLIARKMVKPHVVNPTGEEGGRTEHLFEITATGKKALERAEKDS